MRKKLKPLTLSELPILLEDGDVFANLCEVLSQRGIGQDVSAVSAVQLLKTISDNKEYKTLYGVVQQRYGDMPLRELIANEETLLLPYWLPLALAHLISTLAMTKGVSVSMSSLLGQWGLTKLSALVGQPVKDDSERDEKFLRFFGL